MQTKLLLATLALLTVGLSGCFGFDAAGGQTAFRPGEDWEPTGNTVHLKAAVADLLLHEVYPGFHANLWAFCMLPADPTDEYSAAAIEYFQRVDTDGQIEGVGQDYIDADACSVPAPTIRVKQGDLVKVDFSNNHFHSHTIHWHGQYVPWEHDGVPGVTQDSVIPGESFNYEFIASRAGTLWYHCHVDTHFHVMQGLYGMFIVEPQDDQYEPEDIDKEYKFVYSTLNRELVQVTRETAANPHIKHQHNPGECGASGVQECQNPPVDTRADTWLLNGRSAPNTMADREDTIMVVQEDDRVRIRMLNAGETFETIHTHGHDMLVTHRDGNPIPPAARFYVDTLTIGPAERYDVVIEMTNPGMWVMHSHVDHHVANDQQNPGGNIAVIAYQDILDAQNGVIKPDASENWGGQPYIEPLEIPNDVQYGRNFEIGLQLPGTPGSSSNVDESWDFPWDMPCATRHIQVTAGYDPSAVGAEDLQDLTMQIDGPDGFVEGTQMAIPDNGQVSWILDGRYNPLDEADRSAATTEARKAMIEDLKSGTYTVSVTGTAPPGLLSFHAAIDYFEDHAALEEELIFNTELDLSRGEGQCDPAKRVFDPSA